MSSPFIATTAIMLVIGAIGGLIASATPLPLPYMLGSLLLTSVTAGFGARHLPTGYVFPQNFRLIFIAIIGLMIGARVTLDLLLSLHKLGYSLAAISVFVFAALWANFMIFHRIGGMDRTTAFFAGAPGGLIESITLGEAANADVKQLVMQQFLRIIYVVALVPIAISLYIGHPVGSAGGIPLGGATPMTLHSIIVAILTCAVGLGFGRLLRLPAWQLTGPLIAAAGISLMGLADLNLPQWLINIAQIVIGTETDTDALVDVLKSAGALHSPIAKGDANHGKRLWEVLGLAKDPGGNIGLWKHAEADAAAAGSMSFQIHYITA